MVTRTPLSEIQVADFNEMLGLSEEDEIEAQEETEAEKQRNSNIQVLIEEYVGAVESEAEKAETDEIAANLKELGMIIETNDGVVTWKNASLAGEGGGTEPEGETDV